jgi:hypothetical protein
MDWSDSIIFQIIQTATLIVAVLVIVYIEFDVVNDLFNVAWISLIFSNALLHR